MAAGSNLIPAATPGSEVSSSSAGRAGLRSYICAWRFVHGSPQTANPQEHSKQSWWISAATSAILNRL